jgi:hypothetical protein
MLIRGILAAAAPLVSLAVAGCDAETPTANSASQTSPTTPTATAPTCDAAAISRALGASHTVVRCYGDWAYVDAGGPGDAQALARLVNSEWTRYTAFPTSICQSKAKSDGVPERELANFPSC